MIVVGTRPNDGGLTHQLDALFLNPAVRLVRGMI